MSFAKIVQERVHYDPDTGVFTWKTWPADTPINRALNTKYAGKKALYQSDSRGYLQGRIAGKPVKAHRAAFACMTGEFPDHDVDHINGDRSDNRWSNLRPATRSQNSANSGRRKNSKSRFRGVCWYASRKTWFARIHVRQKPVFIGYFADEEVAARAYDAQAVKHFGEYARLNFPAEAQAWPIGGGFEIRITQTGQP